MQKTFLYFLEIFGYNFLLYFHTYKLEGNNESVYNQKNIIENLQKYQEMQKDLIRTDDLVPETKKNSRKNTDE